MRHAWLVLLTACGRVHFEPLAGDGTADVTTVDAGPLCASWGPFGAPQPVAEFAGMTVDDPAFSADGLTLHVVQSVGGFWNVFHATRATTSASFSTLVADPTLDFANNQSQDPAPTYDGLTIFFISQLTGTYRVYESTRASTADPFGTPAIPTAVQSAAGDSVAVLGDGSALYVEGAGIVLRYAMQGGVPIGPATQLSLARAVTWIAVSADDRELFYNADLTHIGRMTRATPADAFGAEELIPIGQAGGDPGLSPDGTELWVDVGAGGLLRFTRSCL
jgi:hypothetical protein